MKTVKTPKVSIVMPVYNMEEFVKEAIQSVLEQTFTDWELIIVNDGSIDSSYDIVCRYEKQNDNIVLINQENAGLSAARNSGISVARGEYIYFLDSDDSIVPDLLEKCVENCDKQSLDFLFFDAKTNQMDEKLVSKHNLNYVRSKTESYKVSDGLSTMYRLLLNDEFLVSACLIFVRRSFIVDNHLFFLKDIIHEDELYSVRLYLTAKRVMYLPMQLFNRRLRSNSIMTAPISQRNIDSYFLIAKEVRNLMNQYPNAAGILDLYLKKTLNAVLWKAHRLRLNNGFSIFNQMRKDWSSNPRLGT